MAAGKKKSTPKRPAARVPLTLDNITVSWTDSQMGGATRTANGQVLAWLLSRAGHLSGNQDLSALDVATGTGPSLLRGLGIVLFPDAGSPTAERDSDRRFFLSWVMDELAASQHADLMDGAGHAKAFKVTVRA